MPQISIKGHVKTVMKVENGLLFSNAPNGCVVYSNEKEVARVSGPVLDYPIKDKGPLFTFKEL